MRGPAVPAVSMDPVQSPGATTPDTVVIVPAYREASAIRQVVEEIRAALNTLVLVVSRPANDGTEAAAKNGGAIVIEQTGRGKGNAVEQGLDYVRQNLNRVCYIGFVDADCTYPALPMSAMRAILQENPSVGMVVGQRENFKNNGIRSGAFAAGNVVLGKLHQALNHIPLRDPLSGLRMVRAEVVRTWEPRAQGFDIECELNCYVHNEMHLEIAEVPVVYRARVGKKKLGVRHGLPILLRILRMSFSRTRSTGSSS